MRREEGRRTRAKRRAAELETSEEEMEVEETPAPRTQTAKCANGVGDRPSSSSPKQKATPPLENRLVKAKREVDEELAARLKAES